MNENAWYRHFWPWFILALLGTAVSASLTTVVIAVRNADEVVPRMPVASAPDVDPAGSHPGHDARGARR